MLDTKNNIGNGVMLNAYPDSIGERLSDIVTMLKMPEFKDAFSYFYILPTFFNSDLDRGFSVIDYNLNTDLVSEADLEALKALGIELKFDIVLNHLSVASPQFQDLLKHGDQSTYKDFFIDWNTFWEGNGTKGADGVVIPNETYLNKLFMRKSGLPILKVRFPDGTERPYWNTFYQQIQYTEITYNDLQHIEELTKEQAENICKQINHAIANKEEIATIGFKAPNHLQEAILEIVEQKRAYLGQMDVNAQSPLVWKFYDETLKKVSDYGCKILRLDAFAYLHKQVGESNFFNKPGTWDYLERIKQIAQKYNLKLLPEIHAEYGLHLHDEVAGEGYHIYDFFLPGLTIHAIETGTGTALIKWAKEVICKGYKTVNMLGCHDGIPVLDLKGKMVDNAYNLGLLLDEEIEAVMQSIMDRGGRVKNLYDPSGKKISYYQVNATFYSALGEDDRKLLLARAIQLFMPGIPQIWYLDIFAGTNDYNAADKAGSGGHKEINRSTLSMADVNSGLQKDVVIKQLEMIKLRNTSKAFSGTCEIHEESKNIIDITWSNAEEIAHLKANLETFDFTLSHTKGSAVNTMTF